MSSVRSHSRTVKVKMQACREELTVATMESGYDGTERVLEL
jgi:hypothetical protein